MVAVCWFGGKGMYASLTGVRGDEPSAGGCYANQMTGKLGERAARWVSFFAAAPREAWITRLHAGRGKRPWRPGKTTGHGGAGL